MRGSSDECQFGVAGFTVVELRQNFAFPSFLPLCVRARNMAKVVNIQVPEVAPADPRLAESLPDEGEELVACGEEDKEDDDESGVVHDKGLWDHVTWALL